MNTGIDRRTFLVSTAAVGGGMALALSFPGLAGAAEPITTPINPQPWMPPVEGGVEVNPWIVIGADDTVTVVVNQSEIGQGVFTSNPMMICEELECEWSKVKAVYADPHRHSTQNKLYDHLRTDASSSVRLGRKMYQQAGASARERLKAAAAQQWNAHISEIETKDGVLTHKPTGRTLRYGQVAAAAAAITLDKEPSIKTPDQYKLIGKRVRRLDVELKARAQAVYGIDIKLPGMLYAAVKQSPAYGGSLKSFDFAAIKDRPGVVMAVPMTGIGHASGVAVVADTWWRAKTALDAMPIVWNPGPNAQASSEDLFREYRSKLEATGPTPVDEGDAEAVLRASGRIVEAEYQVPHQAHAAMEPPNCTAQVTADKAEVWFGTQAPDVAMQDVVKLTNLPIDKVFVHNTFQGGGFGIGGKHGELAQAVTVAKALNGRPVKVLWTREEDLGHVNGFHPMGVAKFTASLGADGMPTAIRIRIAGNDAVEGAPLLEYGKHKAKVAGQLLRGLQLLPYGIPNRRVEITTMKTFVPSNVWRATGSYANVFYLESFIDELAHAAGKDPIEYRRALINAAPADSFEDNSKADWLKMLDTAAEKSGWGKTLPKGTGMGFAMDDRKSALPRGIVLVALVATVSVSKAGHVVVERFDIVHEAGHAVVNPEAAERQMRGMMAWGMGPAFQQEITFKNGAVVQSNFHDYTPTLLSEVPKEMPINFVKTNRWIAGIGEELVPVVAPAIYNAIQMATGKRIRSIPIRDQDLSWT